MKASNVFISAALIFLVSLPGSAQNRASSESANCPSSGQYCTDRGCIPKVKLLRCRHIELTPAALIAALQDPEPAIRDAAADTLASRATDANKDEAISALTAALNNEKQVRFEMAYALMSLGAQEGFSELRAMCDDPKLSAFRRLSAASALAQAGDEHCVNTVFSVLQSGSEDEQAYALSILPEYKHGSPEQAQRIFDLLVRSLGDQPSIKSAASRALVMLGKSAAVPHFERAIASEHDEQMKAQFEADLQRLRDQQ